MRPKWATIFPAKNEKITLFNITYECLYVMLWSSRTASTDKSHEKRLESCDFCCFFHLPFYWCYPLFMSLFLLLLLFSPINNFDVFEWVFPTAFAASTTKYFALCLVFTDKKSTLILWSLFYALRLVMSHFVFFFSSSSSSLKFVLFRASLLFLAIATAILCSVVFLT